MNTSTINKKPGLNLGKLSAVAQIAVKQPAAADAEIALDRLYSVKQVRKTFENLDELAESLKLNGIIEPLVAHEEADGRYRLIVGERRFRAAPLAGLTKVPVIIKKGLSELQIRRLQVAENNDRDDLSAYEEAMGVIEDVEQYGTKEAMAIWNRGEAWVSKRMAVRRYAEPVRELLQSGRCGDFEVLHPLTQIYELDGSHAEFTRLVERMNEGQALSREVVRNVLSRMKVWQQQQADMIRRREEVAKAKKAPTKKPTSEQPLVSAKAEALADQSNSDAIDQQERGEAVRQLQALRSEVFEWGEMNEALFTKIKEKMAIAGGEFHNLHEMEWVLWQGFLSVALPMLEGIGPERAGLYLKKLQGELRDKTPGELWKGMHPSENGSRNSAPKMPKNWSF